MKIWHDGGETVYAQMEGEYANLFMIRGGKVEKEFAHIGPLGSLYDPVAASANRAIDEWFREQEG